MTAVYGGQLGGRKIDVDVGVSTGFLPWVVVGLCVSAWTCFLVDGRRSSLAF